MFYSSRLLNLLLAITIRIIPSVCILTKQVATNQDLPNMYVSLKYVDKLRGNGCKFNYYFEYDN